MHQLSQPGTPEAFLTVLGLHYLDGENQNKFFELLGQQETKNPEFRRLLKRATSNKFHQYHPQPIKKKQQSNSL